MTRYNLQLTQVSVRNEKATIDLSATPFTATSDDSLRFELPLTPIATQLKDHTLAARLTDKQTIKVSAGYDVFSSPNNDFSSLKLMVYPQTAYFKVADTPVKITFSHNYGGNAAIGKYIIYNVSPEQLWVNGKQITDFRPMVYHYEATIK